MTIERANLHKLGGNTARALNALMAAAFLATAAFSAPTAQAAVPMGFNPAATEVLINRPGSGAEIILARAPSVSSLIRQNMRIYGCVGWQIGRLENIRKYGIDIGMGPCRRVGPIVF